jgi:hypothetical protein
VIAEHRRQQRRTLGRGQGIERDVGIDLGL